MQNTADHCNGHEIWRPSPIKWCETPEMAEDQLKVTTATEAADRISDLNGMGVNFTIREPAVEYDSKNAYWGCYTSDSGICIGHGYGIPQNADVARQIEICLESAAIV